MSDTTPQGITGSWGQVSALLCGGRLGRCRSQQCLEGRCIVLRQLQKFPFGGWRVGGTGRSKDTYFETVSYSNVSAAQLCPTLCDPMVCSPLGSSVHGILQARILEWVAVPSSRGSSWPREGPRVSCIAGRFFTNGATREVPTHVGRTVFLFRCHADLRGFASVAGDSGSSPLLMASHLMPPETGIQWRKVPERQLNLKPLTPAQSQIASLRLRPKEARHRPAFVLEGEGSLAENQLLSVSLNLLLLLCLL